MSPFSNNIESFIKIDGTGNVATFTAGSATYDNALFTTDYTDRLGYDSAVFGLNVTTSLASGESLTVNTATVQDCATYGGSYTHFATLTLATLTASGAAISAGCYALTDGIDLAGAKRYVHMVVKPDLTASGTDTCAYGTFTALGGAVIVPVS